MIHVNAVNFNWFLGSDSFFFFNRVSQKNDIILKSVTFKNEKVYSNELE